MKFIYSVAFVASLSCASPSWGTPVPSESQRAHMTQVWQQEFGFGETPNSESFTSSYHDDNKFYRRSQEPHPAVVRVIVAEQGATSYGSGTLIDVRNNFGLVITNWHVVRDAQGPVEVIFPGGFTSQARPLKVDADWDLAALVIWRPPVPPVKIAAAAPRQGDELTICGYGHGAYRCATGHCTDYYAPRPDFPRQMVELDVEARQGDSGGPIFNSQGELAGVLFGAGQGTTLGSFGGRVESFLATLAPDIGQSQQEAPQLAGYPAAVEADAMLCPSCPPSTPAVSEGQLAQVELQPHLEAREEDAGFISEAPVESDFASEEGWVSSWTPPVVEANRPAANPSGDWRPVRRVTMFDQAKTVLAAIGLLAIVVQLLRAAR